MPKRQLKPKRAQEEETAIDSTLTAEQIAAYVRQSTTFQAENNPESQELQLSGAQRYALSQGLDADKIVIAHEGDGKRGVSGTLRIDQRDRLREIMTDIYAGKIKVVWAYSVSRLFRDKYGVQVATFIEACAKHGVRVVIQTAKTFDFSNSFDIMLFQFLANVAARENEDRAILLHSANNNRAMKGYYNGKPIQPGFIVDRDKHSPTFGRYIPYPPHAAITAQLYRRFRELDGQFNLLANEVGKMEVLFPPFDASVDHRDVKQFKLKKVCKLHGKTCDCKRPDCELVGYHITKPALFRLLTAVENAGYWKHKGELLTDEQGRPLHNHEAIVPLDDWTYAFNKLSFEKLDGEPNTERRARTWTSAGKGDESTVLDGSTEPGVTIEPGESTVLLEGILTSPLGTVPAFGGAYRVYEQREGKMHLSHTLSVDAFRVDILFKARLRERLLEAGSRDWVEQQLARIKTDNIKSLVSVDEQIKQYEKSIKNKQAVLAALGADMDTETMQQYNEEIKEDRVHLNALRDKKNRAEVEEARLNELARRIDKLTGTGELGLSNDEATRRFFRLVTESISIDEFSPHIVTLTIVWRAPFAQIDVCYIWRADAGHNAWSDEEENILRKLYPNADRAVLLQTLPTRSWSSIITRAHQLGILRNTRLNTSGYFDTRFCWKDWQLMTKYGWDVDAPVPPVRIDFHGTVQLRSPFMWTLDIDNLDSASRPAWYASQW